MSRSGCRAAYSIATGPPCAMASRAKRSSPASSATASRSADPGLEAVVGHPAIRQPVTALVVPDHRRDPAELDQVVPPDRALPVELQMAQPARVDQQRRTGAVHGVRDPDPVGRAGEPDVLHRLRAARRHPTILEPTRRLSARIARMRLRGPSASPSGRRRSRRSRPSPGPRRAGRGRRRASPRPRVHR